MPSALADSLLCTNATDTVSQGLSGVQVRSDIGNWPGKPPDLAIAKGILME